MSNKDSDDNNSEIFTFVCTLICIIVVLCAAFQCDLTNLLNIH